MRKILFFIIFILGIGYISYSYFNYQKLMNYDRLKIASSNISYAVYNYIFQLGEEDLTSEESFGAMTQWVEIHYSVLDEHEDILKNGYRIKQDSTGNYYFVISDKDSSNYLGENKLFLTSKKQFDRNKPSFFEYLLSGLRNYDLILFGYKNTQNCLYGKNGVSGGIYSFFEGNQPVNSLKRKEIINALRSFETNYYPLSNIDSVKVDKRSTVFKIKNRALRILCERDKENSDLKKLRQRLKFYIDSINLRLPERGVFSINIYEPDGL